MTEEQLAVMGVWDLTEEFGSILVVATVAGVMTYFQADIEGVSLYVNTVLGAGLALVAATAALVVVREFDWAPEFSD